MIQTTSAIGSRMNKSSHLLWLLVLTVLFVLGWRIVYRPPPEASVSEVSIDLSEIKTTLGIFAMDCGRLPTSAEGFQALFTCPTNISPKLWKGPYFDPPFVPKDPWGHDFVYRCPGIHNTNGYDLYSTGPDGISDDADDIGNWQLAASTNNQ